MSSCSSTPERRIFCVRLIALGSLAAGAARPAGAAKELSPDDPYARAMGFRLDTTQVDQNRYPRHTVDQHCQFCQLWNGGDKDFGNCSFFNGAVTPKTGWCKNFKAKKKAA